MSGEVLDDYKFLNMVPEHYTNKNIVLQTVSIFFLEKGGVRPS